MQSDDFISAAIVTYNDGEEAVSVCRSILENTKRYRLKLYVIDNSETDKTAKLLEKVDGITVLRQYKNTGFGAAHNRVLGEKLGKYHFIINPDIIVNSDVISDMVDMFEISDKIVMAMPKICNPDGSEQKLPKEIPTLKRLFLGRLAPLGGVFAHIRSEYTWADREIDGITDIDFCSGCFCGIRSEVFRKLSGFDERFFMYMEDADLTLRAKQYGRVVIDPSVSVTHAWHRDSAKSIKYLFIHLTSTVKFLLKRRNK